MGQGYTASEEAISAMESTSASLQEAQEQMKQYVSALRSTFDDNEGGVGPHASSINALLEELEALTSEGNAKVLKLVLKLTKASAIRRSILENDRYASGGKTR